VSVARFIADQRTKHQVPHVSCCRILGISVSWLYKWLGRKATAQQLRRGELDAAVNSAFDASHGTYGSPRIHADLLEGGWTVGVNTVAESMRRQGLQGRKPKRRRGLTRQDKNAPKFPDLVKRDFIAAAPNVKWCGDMTEIPTDEGKLYLATVLDLFSRKLLACPTSVHPDAALVCDAIKIAAAVRGGRPEIGGSCSTPTGARATPQGISPVCASVSGCASRWAGSGRQCRRGGLLLHPRTRGAVPASLHHPGRGPRHRGRLVPGFLQHPPPAAQLRRTAAARPLREDHRTTTGRGITACRPSQLRMVLCDSTIGSSCGVAR
jgi:putative transposase